jgi:hypothetical protein
VAIQWDKCVILRGGSQPIGCVNVYYHEENSETSFVGFRWSTREYKVCQFMHKACVSQVSEYLSDMVSSILERTRLRSSSSRDYIVPRTIRKLSERAFSVSSPLLCTANQHINQPT